MSADGRFRNTLLDLWLRYGKCEYGLPSGQLLKDLRFIRARRRAVRWWAWAVPNEEAIVALVKYSPILEIGAGNGYWARLASEAGADVVAVDLYPPPTDKQFFPIRCGGAAVAAEHPDRTLFLCWPPYSDSMAREALEHYTGQTAIYIGEGEGGCTADDRFHSLLDEWDEIEEISIPHWYGLHDRMWVYRRSHQGSKGLGKEPTGSVPKAASERT